MYSIDEKDVVVKLDDVPQSAVGAPCPFIMSDEHTLLLSYIIQQIKPDWDGTSIRVIGPCTHGEKVAVIQFKSYYAQLFGPPNDEAFSGHPLACRGLSPYSAFEVYNSSWLRQLEKMNRVHPMHTASHFRDYRHFIFSFHDSTFECIAKDFVVSLYDSPMSSILPEIEKLLNWSV